MNLASTLVVLWSTVPLSPVDSLLDLESMPDPQCTKLEHEGLEKGYRDTLWLVLDLNTEQS